MEIKTKGIVLASYPYSESDKRLILLTKEMGKVTVFAKGARKSKSKLLAGCQMFSYGDYILYKGKSSYNMNQVSLIESFHDLSKDIERLTYGVFVMEVAEFVSNEDESNHPLMQLILKTLQVLEQGAVDGELIILIFQLKVCTLIGYTPWVSDCLVCNEKEEELYFSSKEGGLLCFTHKAKDSQVIRISEGVAYALQYVIASPIKTLYQFELDNNTKEAFKLVINQFTGYNLNTRFKTLDYFSRML